MRPTDDRTPRPFALRALLALAIVASGPVIAQAQSTGDLPRRAWLGAILVPVSAGGAFVARVDSGGPAAAAGLARGDTVVSIDGASISGEPAIDAAVRRLRAGTTTALELRRGPDRRTVRVALRALPTESLPGRDVRYESVRVRDGSRVRTMVSVPQGAAGTRHAAIVWVPWLDCGSVEIPVGRRHGAAQLALRLGRLPGFVTVRFDKPGAGDSEGDCRALDFEGELEAARAVLQAVRARPDVDPARVFLVGQSFAGGWLPLVAGDTPVAGYIVINSFYRTWYERLIEFERKTREIAGMPAGRITDEVGKLAELYTEFLIRGRTPGEIVAERPHLASVWQDEPAHQYGRPARFFHQLQRLNLAAAWAGVRAPTLAIYGEHDPVMHRVDHESIVAAVNANVPGAARLLVVPRMNHALFLHDTPQQAERDFWSGRFAENVHDEVVRWLTDRGTAR